MSSRNKSKAFLMAGIIDTNFSPFLACFAKGYELKSFKSTTVLLLTVLSLEIICIASSIYRLML